MIVNIVIGLLRSKSRAAAAASTRKAGAAGDFGQASRRKNILPPMSGLAGPARIRRSREQDEIAGIFRAAEPFCPKSDTRGRDRNGNSGTSAFGENARFPYDDGVHHRALDRRA
ncbi:MAG TPA: hypothetical protein VGG01_23625 [Xanthobacteraceae bacterium]